MAEHEFNPERYKEKLWKIKLAEDYLSGRYPSEYPDAESLDPQEFFSGPILDLNDKSLTHLEVAMASAWIEKQLGSKPENARVRTTLLSPDGETKVEIYDKRLGKEDDMDWYISKWKNEQDAQPSYIFWPEEVYEFQQELGYEEI